MQSGETPKIHDILSLVTDAAQDVTEGLLWSSPKLPARPAHSHTHEDTYDISLRGYPGEDGIVYEIPLPAATPSEFHCRRRAHNIHVLLDNVCDLSRYDLLPQTPRERAFWDAYPWQKTQLFITPFLTSLPPCYLLLRVAQSRLRTYRHGAWAIPFAALIAEQWYERYFPHYALLSEALSARTPLGDAARAEWQRLQPVAIPSLDWTVYRIYRWLGMQREGFEFGGKLE